MSDLKRFGISIERNLLKRFDQWVDRRDYANRSEAIRDLVRDRLVDEDWQKMSGKVAATLTFVYDHHVTDLQKELTRLQHEHEGLVHSAMHLHLDHHNCLEVLVMSGSAKKIIELSNRILGARGVRHGQLVRTVAV
jgi:CopG family nickel-responsive transcriptional regulator